MDIRDLFLRLWHRRAAVAAGLAIATVAGLAAIFRIDVGIPPSFEKRQIETGSGVAELVVDSNRSPIWQATAPLEGLINRGALYSSFIQSAPVVDRIARIMDVPPDLIATKGAPPTGLTKGREFEADQRATELSAEDAPYRLFATASGEAPVIRLYTRAPTPGEAAKLARAAGTALTAYVEDGERRNQTVEGIRVRIDMIGAPKADWVNRGARYVLAGLAFLGALLGWVLLLTVANRVRAMVAMDYQAFLLAERESALTSVFPDPVKNGQTNGNGHAKHAPSPSSDPLGAGPHER